MKTHIRIIKKVKMKKPILIEGLPGIGNIGRIATSYFISEMKMKKIAEIYSPHLLPLVTVHGGAVSHMLKWEFFHYKGKRDIVILTGEMQSITPEGHYELCETALDYAEKIGVKEIITLGGYAEQKPSPEPAVIGVVNNKKLIEKYKKYEIDFGKEHKIGTIVGASGLLLGMAKLRNIDALCLMAETMDVPYLTDPKAADKVLQVLVKILNINLDLTKLEKIIKDMEERIKRTEKLYKEIEKMQSEKKDEKIRYIG